MPIVGKGQKPAPPPAPPAPTRRRGTPVADAQVARAAGATRPDAPRPRRRRGTGRATRQPATPWSATELDIRVQIPENLLLRGQDIRRDSAAAGLGDISLVVGGDFRVQKDRRRPTTLVGTITTARGSYEYHGRRFEILRDGRIQFTGRQPDRSRRSTSRRAGSSSRAGSRRGSACRAPPAIRR